MVVQQPIVWATVLFILGTIWGHAYPCPLYFPVLVTLIAVATLFRCVRVRPELWVIAIWFLMGCCRIGIAESEEIPNPCTTWMESVQKKAEGKRTELIGRLSAAGVDGKPLALSAALLLGKREMLQKSTKEAYAHIGASHLLALSGMHLGILYAVLYFFFVHKIRFTEWKWFYLPLILGIIWGYVIIAGMPVSLVRSAIMFSYITIASLAGKQTPPLHVLASSALIILLIHPESLFSISFQLSFAAVFFITILYLPLKTVFRKTNKVVDLFGLSLIAQIGTAPLSIYYFHSLPLLASVVSLVLIPLTTLIIYLCLVTLVMPNPVTGYALNSIINLQDRIIGSIQSIPHITIHHLYPSVMEVVIVYGILLCAALRVKVWFENEDFNQ